jgi:hypothetical protein
MRAASSPVRQTSSSVVAVGDGSPLPAAHSQSGFQAASHRARDPPAAIIAGRSASTRVAWSSRAGSTRSGGRRPEATQ